MTALLTNISSSGSYSINSCCPPPERGLSRKHPDARTRYGSRFPACRTPARNHRQRPPPRLPETNKKIPFDRCRFIAILLCSLCFRAGTPMAGAMGEVGPPLPAGQRWKEGFFDIGPKPGRPARHDMQTAASKRFNNLTNYQINRLTLNLQVSRTFPWLPPVKFLMFILACCG